ncbi:hypothetical protein [Methanobrevibacter filiformis]|uniref:PepSY domain-containing protein n=1 Tax=Methanobrevibacter filiformis TaxID=55758 RepID=A0A165ZK85_9EURY|nr:hypothetical protein [Methanobrevibacter filiformis]KZX10824.1 hypothetical protein MBFIL_16060 [Methanobrevibacter filiformis]
MKNLNIIISIIIVLAIAAAVTAYGITNPDNNIFSSLDGYSPDSSSDSLDTGSADNGVGTNDTQSSNDGSGSEGVTTTGSGNGASGSGSSGNGTSASTHDGMSISEAKNIVNGKEKEHGFHAGTPSWDKASHLWFVPVLDENGTKVDTMSVDPKTKKTGRA